MRFLLDTNALLALGFQQHDFHSQMAGWLAAADKPTLLTCAITELGFIRVLAQAPAYGLTVAQARDLLLRLKQNAKVPVHFLSDNQDAARLPEWVRTPKQLTDGHLLELARAHNAELATLDRGIPGALVIPAAGNQGPL